MKFFAHLPMICVMSFAHSWAHWCALSRNPYDWTGFYEWLPLLLVVVNIVLPMITIVITIGFWAQNQFEMRRSIYAPMFAAVYFIWLVSAVLLYALNDGVDAYSATLGTFIYIPFHAGAAFVISLLVTAGFASAARADLNDRKL